MVRAHTRPPHNSRKLAGCSPIARNETAPVLLSVQGHESWQCTLDVQHLGHSAANSHSSAHVTKVRILKGLRDTRRSTSAQTSSWGLKVNRLPVSRVGSTGTGTVPTQSAWSGAAWRPGRCSSRARRSCSSCSRRCGLRQKTSGIRCTGFRRSPVLPRTWDDGISGGKTDVGETDIHGRDILLEPKPSPSQLL